MDRMSAHTFLVRWNGDVVVVLESLLVARNSMMAEDRVLVEEMLEVGIVVLLVRVIFLFAPLVVALSSVAAAATPVVALLLACTAAQCNAARNYCAELELIYNLERCGGGRRAKKDCCSCSW